MSEVQTSRPRQLTLAGFVVILSLISTFAMAQECSPDDISFSSQEEVDRFQLDYGGGNTCDTIGGSLWIEGPDIVHLDSLADLTGLGGALVVRQNAELTSLEGLSGLRSIGESCDENDNLCHSLKIEGNAKLLNLDALSNVSAFPADVSITGNEKLSHLDGLSSIETIGGEFRIMANNSLENINALSSLTDVGSARESASLIIGDNPSLTSLEGLGSLTQVNILELFRNNALHDLAGLNGLERVETLLYISHHELLANLDGLSNLRQVFTLLIRWNESLQNVDGLAGLTIGVNSIDFTGNDSLTDLDGLSNLIQVNYLTLYDNLSLHNVDGLSGLTTGVNSIGVVNNDFLDNLNGLSNLQELEYIYVRDNEALSDCQGLLKLIDPVDDYLPGPGPLSASIAGVPIPDVFREGIVNNLDGCNSPLDIVGHAHLHEMNAALNDAWFNPVTDGQGFFIVVYPELSQIFLAWFTYDVVSPDPSTTHQLGAPGQRWLTAQGEFNENTAELTVWIAEGGEFDSPQPEPVLREDGEILLHFSGCDYGMLTYDIPSINAQGVIPIQRVARDNVLLCYQLNLLNEQAKQ